MFDEGYPTKAHIAQRKVTERLIGWLAAPLLLTLFSHSR